MSEVCAYLDKAARSFEAAEMLVSSGDADFGASRAYYGCFYIAEALLFDKGSTPSTHAGTISEYGGLFAKTGRLDPRFHQLLNRSFRARQSADYSTDFDLNEAEVREIIVEGREFLDAARDYFERNSTEDTTGRE